MKKSKLVKASLSVAALTVAASIISAPAFVDAASPSKGSATKSNNQKKKQVSIISLDKKVLYVRSDVTTADVTGKVQGTDGDVVTVKANINGTETEFSPVTIANGTATFTGAVNIPTGLAEGKYTVTYTATGSSSTLSNTYQGQLIVDNTAPVVDAIAKVEKQSSYSTITFKVDDLSGVDTIMATLDGQAYTIGSSVTAGEHIIVATVVDRAGNQTEYTETLTVTDAATTTSTVDLGTLAIDGTTTVDLSTQFTLDTTDTVTYQAKLKSKSNKAVTATVSDSTLTLTGVKAGTSYIEVYALSGTTKLDKKVFKITVQ